MNFSREITLFFNIFCLEVIALNVENSSRNVKNSLFKIVYCKKNVKNSREHWSQSNFKFYLLYLVCTGNFLQLHILCIVFKSLGTTGL